LHLLDDADQVGGISQVAIMQPQTDIALMRILIEVVNTLGIEGGGAAFNAVNFVALCEQEFSQVGPSWPVIR